MALRRIEIQIQEEIISLEIDQVNLETLCSDNTDPDATVWMCSIEN